jgi:hypothetical protein
MNQITVRGIAPKVEKRIRRKAKATEVLLCAR